MESRLKIIWRKYIDGVAAEYDVPVLAKLPMDPALT